MEVKQMESKQTKASQTIQLHCLENRVASGYVTFGSYWEKGTLSIPNFKNDGMDSFILQNENKESIPVQSRITAWWPDGSIKWAAHPGHYPARRHGHLRQDHRADQPHGHRPHLPEHPPVQIHDGL